MQYLHIQPTTNLLSELDGQSWESCVHAEGWTHTYTHTKPKKQTINNTKIFVLSDDLIYSLDEYTKVDIRTRVCAKSYLELLFARMQALHEWPETIITRGKFCINDSRIALLLLSARQLPISLNKEHFMAFQTVSTDAGRKKKWHQKKKKSIKWDRCVWSQDSSRVARGGAGAIWPPTPPTPVWIQSRQGHSSECYTPRQK